MAKWSPFASRDSAIELGALVVPAGATVLLRPAKELSAREYGDLKAALQLETARTGVKFVVVTDADWQAVVIGAPE